MGVVLAAYHLQLDERVAIKLPLPEALGNAEAVARFLREARAAVKIKSEYVARVSDVGALETGEPFIVMEYLEGQDLAAWLKQKGALPIEQAVEFVLQACEALAEAHSLGIVHRDLKPANLFCIRRADGVLALKVLDFGISKGGQGAGVGFDASMTRAGAIMGSPLYMSPEQMASARDVDARSDIWAIGVILFELLAASPPFMSDTLPGLSLLVAQSPPRWLSEFRADVPPLLEQVILRCLEKDRQRRFANVAELSIALFEFAPKRARASVERISRVIQNAGLSSSTVALPPSSDETLASRAADRPREASKESGSTAATFGHTASPQKAKTQPIVFAGVAALVVGAAATVWAWSQRTNISAATPAPRAVPTLKAASAVEPLPVLTPSLSAAPVDSGSTGIASHPKQADPSTRRPGTRVKVPVSPGASAQPGPNCNPNFYFDSQGGKHFRPECFQ
jgi:serine/threonine-protein kinase